MRIESPHRGHSNGFLRLERLIGDLSISINAMNGGALQGKLLDLCDRLEAAEKYGDGMLEEL